jgi:hypothetical protein
VQPDLRHVRHPGEPAGRPHELCRAHRPARHSGLTWATRSDRGSLLAKPMTAHFTTEPFCSLALADLPGQLGYLPGAWRVSPSTT